MNIIPLKDRFFELIDGSLYCFDKALAEAGLSVNYYRKEKSQVSKRLVFIDHPNDGRYSLVAFNSISDAHQLKIKERFGNPYNFIVREPIMKMVKNDDTAAKFYLGYRYCGDKIIPIKRVKQYTRAASWLNLLKEVEDSRNKMIKSMGITVPEFYDHLKSIIEEEKTTGANERFDGSNQLYAKFPSSYDKLRTKLNEYREAGYACIIDKMYGNQSAAKVKDEVSEAQLLSLIENPMQYDDVLVCMMYNVWAEKNGYKLIDPATVGVWRRKKAVVVTMSREGNSAMNERFIRQVKGSRPSVPLALVEHDDNNLDFLFTDAKGYEFNKYVAITVVDSRTKLLLGKSYMVGQSPQQWQVYHAYLDAMYYLRSLTGGWYLPHELKADKWASKSLTPFYSKIGKFIPPSHGNKHRGYIEQFFGSPLWKRSQQLVSQNNWTGNNITAKTRGVNDDVLRLNVKNRPMIGNEAELQIENFFHLLRHMPDFKRDEMDAKSKEQQFIAEWNEMKQEDKRMISDEQFLLTFGIEHRPQNRSITISNRGIEPQIGNNKYSYDMPEAWMYERYNGAKVQVVYDPYDMSRVLITNNDDIRFIATTAQLQPRALKDQYCGSRTYLNAILEDKKEMVKKVTEEAGSRQQLVDRSNYNAEAILQGGALIKEMKNEAEARYLEGTNNAVDFDPTDLM